MPKERFHLYLADELLNRCAGSLPPHEIHSAQAHPRSLAFSIGAISPDIFFYDWPSFSLSPLGDALHGLIDRQGISVICDWIAHSSGLNRRLEDASTVLWALGFASHFLIDCGLASGNKRIERLGLADYCGVKRLSEIECHRLLESELEALWLARSRTPKRYDDLLRDFKKDRGRLLRDRIILSPIPRICGTVRRGLRKADSQMLPAPEFSSPVVCDQDAGQAEGTVCSHFRQPALWERSLRLRGPSCRPCSHRLCPKIGIRSATTSWNRRSLL